MAISLPWAVSAACGRVTLNSPHTQAAATALSCRGRSFAGMIFREDCLVLNVWSPKKLADTCSVSKRQLAGKKAAQLFRPLRAEDVPPAPSFLRRSAKFMVRNFGLTRFRRGIRRPQDHPPPNLLTRLRESRHRLDDWDPPMPSVLEGLHHECSVACEGREARRTAFIQAAASIRRSNFAADSTPFLSANRHH